MGGEAQWYGDNKPFSEPVEVQGKEKEMTFNLNRVDFGARVLNPTIGRWDKVDPAAELYYEFSGYNYVLNSPTSLTDPNGKWVEKDGGLFTNNPAEIASFYRQYSGKIGNKSDERSPESGKLEPKLLQGVGDCGGPDQQKIPGTGLNEPAKVVFLLVERQV